MIAPQSGGCVAHALSVMRLALGYADGVPETLRDDAGGGKSDHWILANAAAWFPEHEVLVRGLGDSIDASFEHDAWLIGYGYRLIKDGAILPDQHFVIGAPDFRTAVTIVVGVRLTGRGYFGADPCYNRATRMNRGPVAGKPIDNGSGSDTDNAFSERSK